MSFEVVRSPAKVCWWVMCNGVLLSTADTKAEANKLVNDFRRNYA